MASNVDMVAIKAAAKRELNRLSGIEGFGIREGNLRVYVRDSESGRQLPKVFHGVNVECVVTGDLVAHPKA